MRIGLRIWKTGIATIVTLIIASLFTPLDPVLAVVTAILSLQPSVAESIKRGWNRIKATIIGAIIGISLTYLGLHVFKIELAISLLAGLGVVLSIVISNKLKIQDGAVIGAIAVVATMVGISHSILADGAYRLLSTLMGIFVASAINLILVPPQYRPKLLEEFKTLNQSIIVLFKDAIDDFIFCGHQDLPIIEKRVEELKEQLEKAKQHLSYYKDELGYRRYLTNVPTAIVKEVVIFEKTIKVLDFILDRILDISKTTESRLARKGCQEMINEEYGKLLAPIEQMTKIVNQLQANIICILDTYDMSEVDLINTQLDELDSLKKELHSLLNTWHFSHQTEDNLLSLMEISIVAYDIGQVAEYLRRLSKKLISKNNKEQEGV